MAVTRHRRLLRRAIGWELTVVAGEDGSFGVDDRDARRRRRRLRGFVEHDESELSGEFCPAAVLVVTTLAFGGDVTVASRDGLVSGVFGVQPVQRELIFIVWAVRVQ